MSIFKKIIAREIPADIVYENDHCLGFRDIQPQAPVHILVIPKKEIRSLADIDPQEDRLLLGHLLTAASEIAKQENIHESGYRTLINTNGHAGQTVFHLHLHVLGGEPLVPMG